MSPTVLVYPDCFTNILFKDYLQQKQWEGDGRNTLLNMANYNPNLGKNGSRCCWRFSVREIVWDSLKILHQF